MIDVLPEIVTVVFLIFCLIDCIQTDSILVRNLPKVAWIILIILLPLVGGVAWLVAGRPQRSEAPGAAAPWSFTRTADHPQNQPPASARASTEIDDQLRRDQERVDREFEEALRKDRDRVKENQESLRRWEDDLRERERRLQERPPDDDPPGS